MTQTHEKPQHKTATNTKNKSLTDLESECLAQMANHGFYNVQTPLDLSGTRVNFIEKQEGKKIKAWYFASVNENGQLNVTYNSNYGSIKHDGSDGKKGYVYSSKSRKLQDDKENIERFKRVSEMQKERAQKNAEEEEKTRKKKAEYSRERFDNASEKGSCLYLQRKQVGEYGVRFEVRNGETILIIPMRDENGEIQALQEIYPTKRLFIGSDKPRDKNFTNSVKGLFHVLGEFIDGQLIRVSEGYATAASCYESTGNTIPHVVSFSDGAYSTIIPILRRKYPNSYIKICADGSKDQEKKGSGIIEAEKALKSIGNINCSYVIPKFYEGNNTNDKGELLKDFNDLMIAEGKEEVKAQIEQAKKEPEMKTECGEETWEEPAKIESEDDLEVIFPIESLPDVLKSAIKEIARYVQVDPALVIVPALGITCLQIGKKTFIKEKEGLLHHPSLFLCSVAESGERKSACQNVVLDPIKDAIDKEQKDYEIAKAKVRAHNEIISSQIEGIKQDRKAKKITPQDATEALSKLYMDEKKTPPSPLNFGEDLTPERLFQKLGEHEGSYGVISSDARSVFDNILGRRNKGQSGEAIYISGMWGDDIQRSRVGGSSGKNGENTGEDLFIRKPALTIAISIQPDDWTEFSKTKKMRDSGLIARIGVVIPKSFMGERLEKEGELPLQKEIVEPFWNAVLKLRRWKPRQPVIISLSKEAAICRREFYNNIEKELGSGGRFEDVKDIAAKACSLASRIALVFMLLNWAHRMENSEFKSFPEISKEEWLQAQALEEYFLCQAIDSQRLHGRHGSTHTLLKAAKWLKNQLEKGRNTPVLASEMAKGVRGSTKEDMETTVIPELVKHKWLKSHCIAQASKQKYSINPRILDV